ncbi:MAG: hypothetical protein AAFQ41_11265, partial [Cyanobacteria bacterium J06623_7]
TFGIVLLMNFSLFIVFVNEEIILPKEFIIIIHSCISIVIFLYFGNDFLNALLVKTKILVNKQDFYLEHSILGIKQKSYESTKHIDAITVKKEIKEVQQNGSSKKAIIREYCIIYAGIKEYKFGRWLAKREKQQLAIEIHEFIKKTILS